MHIAIGEHWEKFVEKSVEDGHYGSASEVVQEGLRLVEQRAAKLAILRREIEDAIAEGGDVSDEELEAALEEKAAELAKQGFKMPRARYSAEAKRDLLEILEYITRSSGSHRIGLGFTESLRHRCANLAALPGQMGRPRPELGEDIRSFAFRGYIIVFRYANAAFEVVRVYEGHRDLDSTFHDHSM